MKNIFFSMKEEWIDYDKVRNCFEERDEEVLKMWIDDVVKKGGLEKEECFNKIWYRILKRDDGDIE